MFLQYFILYGFWFDLLKNEEIFFKKRIEVKNIVYSLNIKDEKDKEIMNLIEEIGKQKFK